MVDLKYAIALTGGMATGKSTTAALLKLYGFNIIDADAIAHKVLEEQKEDIRRLFGEEYIKEGRVDRKALGKLVFGDENERRKLERLLHPKIKEEILRAAKKQEEFEVPYFIDIPLYFETRNYPLKKAVVVYTPKDIQTERLAKREGLEIDEARQRVLIQMDIEQKRALADYVIDNSRDLKHLQKEVERFVERIKDEYGIG